MNLLYGCCPTLRETQSCWALRLLPTLISLMLLGIIPALTIYKIPTATQYVQMRMHLTTCQNNRPIWDHFSVLGLLKNTILRSGISCQVQAGGSFVIFPKWVYYIEHLSQGRMFYRDYYLSHIYFHVVNSHPTQPPSIYVKFTTNKKIFNWKFK